MISVRKRQQHPEEGGSDRTGADLPKVSRWRFSGRKWFLILVGAIILSQVVFYVVTRQSTEAVVAQMKREQEALDERLFGHRVPRTRNDADGGELVGGLEVLKGAQKALMERQHARTSGPSAASKAVHEDEGEDKDEEPVGGPARIDRRKPGFTDQDGEVGVAGDSAREEEDKEENDREVRDGPGVGGKEEAARELHDDDDDDEGDMGSPKTSSDEASTSAREVGDEEEKDGARGDDEDDHEDDDTIVGGRRVPGPVPLSIRTPYIRRATPPPPTPCPPPLLMPGRSSLVSATGVFTVVTVVWNAKSLTPLEELVRSMHYTSLVHHSRFLELLVYVSVSADLSAGDVRRSILDWWRDAAVKEHGESPDSTTGVGTLVAKVRVVLQPLKGPSRPYQRVGDISPAPATIVEAMRLVRSEFVVFNPVEDPLYLFPKLWRRETGDSNTSGDADAPASGRTMQGEIGTATSQSRRLEPLRRHVRTVMNIALQTMGNNMVVQDNEPDAPLVIDQADFLRRDEVHAFRLQLYPSSTNMPHDAALAKQMDQRISHFLRAVARDMERTARADDGAQPQEEESVPGMSLLHGFPDLHENEQVVHGLPKAFYGTDTPYHCQRAPIYGVGIYIPSFFRSAEANAVRNERGLDNPEDRAAALWNRSMTSLCEALLTSPVRMKDLRAQDGFFARDICKAWQQLTGQQYRHSRRGRRQHPQTALPSLFPQTRASLCDGACSFDWLTALKNEQLYVEDASRRRRNPLLLLRDRANTTATAKRSPLHAFARMIFTTNQTEALSYADRFFPFAANASASLEDLRLALREVITPEAVAAEGEVAADLTGEAASATPRRTHQRPGSVKKEAISVKYVVQDQRHRRDKRKMDGDAEVLCFSSHLCAFTLEPTLYRTDWVVGNVLSRCLRHPAECGNVFGSPVVAAEQLRKDPDGVARRQMGKMAHYLSQSGKWGKGEYKVCMTSGFSIHDPNSLLHHSRTVDPFAV